MIKPPIERAFTDSLSTTGFFLYPLKTSEYRNFSNSFRGLERDQWHGMGLKRKKKVGKIETTKTFWKNKEWKTDTVIFDGGYLDFWWFCTV